MVLKFAANLSTMFTEAGSIVQRYDAAAKAGFKFVESALSHYDVSAEDLRSAKDKCQLKQVLINAPVGIDDQTKMGFACVPGKTAEFRESIEKAIRYAEVLQCSNVHVMAGKVQDKVPCEQVKRLYVENLEYAANRLLEANICCLIEPINRHSVPGYFLSSYDEAVPYLTIPNVKLQLDIFHMQIICGDLTRNITSLLPYIGHIQISQVPDRHEPDSPGEIDYSYVFSLLQKLGYSGFIGCEYFPFSDTFSGLKWMSKFA